MIDFKDFVFKLQLMQIPTEAVLACESFVMKEMNDWYLFDKPKGTHSASFDLGFAELSDITSKDQSIQEIVNSIFNNIMDFDAAGRDISKRRYAQLVKQPSKGLKRRVLKSFYLHYWNLDEPQKEDEWANVFNVDVDQFYRLNAFKETA